MYSKRVEGSLSVGGGMYGVLLLMRGTPPGDGGHDGIKTVGNWMVWKAAGGVGADTARRPLCAGSRLRLRGGDGTGMMNEMPSSVSCSPSRRPLPFFPFFTLCGR